MGAKCDFAGYATKNDLLCSDGRTIRNGAFAGCDGMTVPLVWNHGHKDPTNVLGHALLENREDGVYAYCTFNNTAKANHIKEAVKHGDLNGLSIYANQLVEKSGDVLHGAIREVSLVLSRANPGAKIDTVLAHSDWGVEAEFDEEDRGVFWTGEPIVLYHSDEDPEPEDTKDDSDKGEGELEHAEDGKNKEKTVGDIVDTMNEEQVNVMNYLIEKAATEAVSGSNKQPEKEDKEVKHNAFESQNDSTTLAHSIDMKQLLADAKRIGSLKEAFIQHCEALGIEEGNVLMHGTTIAGGSLADSERYGIMSKPGDVNSLGIEALFPEYKSLNNPPDWIKRDTGWVDGVMRGVHHTPFSRIKSVFADITEDDARARGYMKGNRKKDEVFSLLKRTTDPQTVYKRQKLDRDDIIDITDFDVVVWIKAEMRMMLEEEIARAILIGDGRPSSSDDKIKEEHIRSIYHDDDFYSNKVVIKVPAGASEDVKAKTTIRAVIKARKDYKGSGQPTFYTTSDVLTDMLLLEDANGRIIYDTMEKLKTALRVKDIVEVEVMEGQTRKGDDNVTRPLIGIIVNLNDYNVGADKGGAVGTFEDFDIDYNQYKYLIETRFSGALIKPHSAMVLEMEEAEAQG